MGAKAQSMLCTYKGGYFIRDGNNWYEYRPEKKNNVWAVYTQYSTDNNYYYIQSTACKVCVPKKKTSSIYMYNTSKSDWEVVYNTINIYDYCPVRSSQIFCYTNGFFVKDGNTWKQYIPEKRRDGSWATFTQYKSDADYYYVKNDNDDLAIPRKETNSFFWYKSGDWSKLYDTVALYDAQSPNARSGQNYAAVNKSSANSSRSSNENYSNNNSNSKSAGSGNKTKSWRQEFPTGGYCDYVTYEDGSMTATTVTPCVWCHGTKVCGICNGLGGFYGRAYGGMWYPCKSCAGTKVCQNCHGTGFSTLVTRVQNGVGIGYDQNGNVYSAGGGGGGSGSSTSNSGSSNSRSRSSSGSSSSNDYIETIEYAPNYTGKDNSVWCEKCQKVAPRHSHIRKRVY